MSVWEAGDKQVVIKDFGVADSYSGTIGLRIHKSNAVSVFGGYYCNNGEIGIQIEQSSNTQIGLDEAGANPVVISGNSQTGIFVWGNSVDTKIANVFIGVDWTGLVAMPNRLRGIEATSGVLRFTVGSETPGVLTVISGNYDSGMFLAQVSTTYISGVFIGVGKDGITRLGNNGDGITLMAVSQKLEQSGDEARTTIGKEGILTVISGNYGNGVQSQTSNLHVVGKTFIGLGSDGKTACPNRGTAGLYIGTSGVSIGPGVVVSGNSRRGIYISAQAVYVDGVYVGVSQDGTVAVPNKLDGIFVTESASSGVKIKGGVISGNGGSGIFTDGARMELSSSIIGLSADGKTALPNEHHGIEIGKFGESVWIGMTAAYSHDLLAYSQPAAIGSVTISGNLLGGIKSAGQRLTICNALVGLSTDGLMVVPNGGTAGVEILQSGKDSFIGSKYEGTGLLYDGRCTVAVAGNEGHGLAIYAPDVEANKVSIGASPAGNALQILGGTFGNKGVGIMVHESASGTNIIACTICGSGSDGIRLHGPNATVNLNTIGQGEAHGTESAGNQGSGLHIKATSAGTSVGGAPSSKLKFENFVGCQYITVAGTKMVDGIYKRNRYKTFNGASTYRNSNGKYDIYRCNFKLVMIGDSTFSSADSEHCNGYVQIRSDFNNVAFDAGSWYQWTAGSWKREEGISAIADCKEGNFIAANYLQGIRDDTSADDNVAISDQNIVVIDLTDVSTASPNGRGLNACEMCTCTSTTVDCRPAVGNPDRDFGPSFPTNLPAATTELYMSNVGLLHVDWTEIAKISETLKVLDLAQNHNVDPLPETGQFDKNVFPALEVISFSGTDLTRLTADTFANLNGDLIDTLDLSAPSKQPAASNIPLNLKGFSKPLAAILWYSNSCPPGYYATSGSPAQPVRLSFDHLMTIVVSDSFSSHFFLKLLLSLMSCRMECLLNFTQIDLLCYVWI